MEKNPKIQAMLKTMGKRERTILEALEHAHITIRVIGLRQERGEGFPHDTYQHHVGEIIRLLDEIDLGEITPFELDIQVHGYQKPKPRLERPDIETLLRQLGIPEGPPN